MEYEWERKFPFLEIDNNTVRTLFETILESNDIITILPITEGCRTTNYIVETKNSNKKYILKIFFSMKFNYKKEIKLLYILKENKNILVPKIYKVSSDNVIGDREYAIYEYMEGKTIGQAVKEGYVLEENLVRDVAMNLAKIHAYKFDKAGLLDENLNISEELPPLFFWYKNFMGHWAKKRLGEKIIDEINSVVEMNKNILIQLDEDVRLIHGDFQGTNILMNDGRLGGILDWEFVMAGHPLSDIGQFFRYEEYFNKNLVQIFEDEYNKNSSYKLIKNWYEVSKLLDLANLIQLIDSPEDMPNKYENIKKMIVNILKEII